MPLWGSFPRGSPAVGLADALLDSLRLDEVALASAYSGLDIVPPAIGSAPAPNKWEVRRVWVRGESFAFAGYSRD